MKIIVQITILILVVIAITTVAWNLIASRFPQAASVFGETVSGHAGIWKSDDGGGNWKEIGKLEDGKSAETVNILDFRPHPTNPDVFFIASDGRGILKSPDKGENWTNLKDKNGVLSEKAVVFGIDIAGKEANIFYVPVFQGDRSYVLKSKDGGESFSIIYIASTPAERVYAVKADIFDPLKVYLITDTGLFLKTLDGGSSWSFSGKLRVGAKKITVTREGVIYLFNLDSTISKSENDGLNWSDINLDLTRTANKEGEAFISLDKRAALPFISFFVVDGNFSNVIYVGSGNQVFRSYNGGKSWSPMNLIVKTEAVSVMSFTQNPRNPRTLYVGVGGYVYKSLDNGDSWSVHKIQDTGKILKFLFISGDAPDSLFAVFNNG